MALRAWLLMAVAMILVLAPSGAAAAPAPTWHSLVHLEGVFDVAGPTPDGRVVVAGSKGLFLLGPGASMARFAPGYRGETGEAYLTVSPGLDVGGAGCRFEAGDVFVLRLGGTPGVLRIGADGAAHDFAALPGMGTLNGIVFDSAGRFGHRLLVSGGLHGGTSVAAVDCHGARTQVTDSAPALEGGLAVAPAGFGRFAGDLVGPDELSGRLIAITPDGSVSTMADSGLPSGQDVGVESLGFVPSGFLAGGTAYVADRATSNSPHPGTDSLLSLDAGQLAAAGVREGDLLAATEGGDRTIAVRCAAQCQVREVVSGSAVAHGEGHLLLATGHPASAGGLPSDPKLGAGAQHSGLSPLALAGIGVGAAAIVAALGLVVIGLTRRRRRPGT